MLPLVEKAAKVAVSAVVPVPGEYFLVKPPYGDLKKIAQAAYGDPTLWHAIGARNRIAEPDLVYPLQIIFIPVVINPAPEMPDTFPPGVSAESMGYVFQEDDEEGDKLDEDPKTVVSKGKPTHRSVYRKGTFVIEIGGTGYIPVSGRFMCGIDMIASAWSGTFPWIPGRNKDFDTKTKRGAFTDTVVYVDGEQVGKGDIFSQEAVAGAEGGTKTVECYSKTKHLVDCSLQLEGGEYNGMMLKQIVISAVEGYGITVDQIHDDGGKKMDLCSKVGVETVANFVQKVAARYGMFCSTNADGALVLQKAVNMPPESQANQAMVRTVSQIVAPQTTEKMKKYNVPKIYYQSPPVSEWSHTWDDSKLYAEYTSYHTNDDGTVISQSGSDDTCAKGFRELIFEGKDLVEGRITDSIAFALAKRAFEANSFKITVSRLRDDFGKLWMPNKLVFVKAAPLGILTETMFLVRTVEYVFTPDSAVAVLDLVPPFRIEERKDSNQKVVGVDIVYMKDEDDNPVQAGGNGGDEDEEEEE
jgi:prophage tail gpP-like protein